MSSRAQRRISTNSRPHSTVSCLCVALLVRKVFAEETQSVAAHHRPDFCLPEQALPSIQRDAPRIGWHARWLGRPFRALPWAKNTNSNAATSTEFFHCGCATWFYSAPHYSHFQLANCSRSAIFLNFPT